MDKLWQTPRDIMLSTSQALRTKVDSINTFQSQDYVESKANEKSGRLPTIEDLHKGFSDFKDTMYGELKWLCTQIDRMVTACNITYDHNKMFYADPSFQATVEAREAALIERQKLVHPGGQPKSESGQDQFIIKN